MNLNTLPVAAPAKFVVIGLGGYGLTHIEAVRWLASKGLGSLVGVVALEVDRKARPEMTASLLNEGVRLFGNVEEFYASGLRADVLTVPVGINMHVPLTIAAMRAGLHVYCEKPAAATVQEVDALIAVQHDTGRTVAIGFQHISSQSIQELKTRIVDGRLGPVLRASLLCGWPRSEQYYARNEWTGRLRVGDDWILDSPANNAHAHYLMNLLYLCSSRRNTAAVPSRVRAELYRANPIESPDTVQLKIEVDSGAWIHCCLTHANAGPIGPSVRLECMKGKVYWETDNGKTIIRYKNGKSEEFDNLMHDNWRYDGFRDFVSAIREGREPLCTPSLARSQTLAINAMHESCPTVTPIPEAHVSVVEDWEMFPPNTKGLFHRVRSLDEYLRIAIEEDAFLSDIGVPWAVKSSAKWFRVGKYLAYPRERVKGVRARAARWRKRSRRS
jgi:predicted dehydrogenase